MAANLLAHGRSKLFQENGKYDKGERRFESFRSQRWRRCCPIVHSLYLLPKISKAFNRALKEKVIQVNPMVNVSLCLFLFCIVACNGSLESPEERFWKWFGENSTQLMNLDLQRIDSNQQHAELYAELVEHIIAVHPDLSFEFSPPSDSSREFIITADGSRQAVPAVDSLASVAPALKGWTIIPFIPRMDFIPAIGYGGLEFDPKDIEFSLERINGKVGVTFHFKGYQPDDDRYQAVAFLYATSILGERDVMMKSAFVEVDGDFFHDTRPITELASAFDSAVTEAGK